MILVDLTKIDADVRAMIRARNFGEAEAIVQEALKRSGKEPHLYYLLALSVMKRSPAEAGEAVDRSIELDGSSADARMLQLKLATDSGDEARIASAAEAAVFAVPDSIGVLTAAARALFKVRRYLSAMRAWRRIEALSPDETAPVLGILRALAAASDAAGIDNLPPEVAADGRGVAASEIMAEAIKRLADMDPGAAISFLPHLSGAHIDVAAVALIKAREAGILESDSFAVARASRDLLRRADLAFGQSDYTSAARDYRMVLQLKPTIAMAEGRFRQCLSFLIAIGCRHYVGRDLAAAATHFETVLTLDPNNLKALRWLCFSLERAGGFERSADAWRRLAEASRDPVAWARALNAATKTRLSPWKLEIFAAARPELPADSVRIRQGNMLAAALSRALRPDLDASGLDEAMQTFRAIQRWDPNQPFAIVLRRRLRKFLLSAIGAEQGVSADEAFRLTRMLAEVDPANIVALQRLGRIYFSRGETGKALETYQRLVELHPNQIEFQDRVTACLALMNGRSQSAA